MLSVTELRNGTIYKENGAPWLVTKYQHTKVGRGNASIRVKIKNLVTGTTLERTYQSGASVEEADVEKVKAQYLYKGGNVAYFMQSVNYEQWEIPLSLLGENVNFVKDGQEVYVFLFEGHPVSVELPLTVELTITETEPGFKGDTATSAFKPATLETGYKTMVPLFVKTADRVKIDTRTGEYLERA